MAKKIVYLAIGLLLVIYFVKATDEGDPFSSSQPFTSDNIQPGTTGTTTQPNTMDNVGGVASGSVPAGTDVSRTDNSVYLSEAEDLETTGGAKASYGTDITIYDNGDYSFGTVDSLVDGILTIINGINVVFQNGIITADHVDSIVKDSSVITNIERLETDKKIVSVEKADTIVSGCITVNEIKDTTIIITEDDITMQADENANLKIEDCGYADTEFNALADSEISINKENPSLYKIENGTLSYEQEEYTETIEANDTAIVTVSPVFGFTCMSINPVGIYKYDPKDITKFFALKVWKQPHKICIRKDISQDFFLEEDMTVVDLVDKKINTKGVVEYQKFWFNYLALPFYLVDFDLHPVFSPFSSTTAILDYDDNMVYFDKGTVSSEKSNVFVGVNSWLSFTDVPSGKSADRIFKVNA